MTTPPIASDDDADVRDVQDDHAAGLCDSKVTIVKNGYEYDHCGGEEENVADEGVTWYMEGADESDGADHDRYD